MAQSIKELYRKKLKKPTKYIIIGISATVIDFCVFMIILHILNGTYFIINIKSEQIANIMGVLVGFCYCFLLNRNWAFRSNKSAWKQFIATIILLIINLFISSIFISFMDRIWKVPFAVSKIIIQGSVAIWNYFIYENIIYR